MKAPEELVRDLRTIARYLRCSQCFVECSPKEECVFTAAAKLIEELEQVKREKDALKAELKNIAKGQDVCTACRHYSSEPNCEFECEECRHRCMCYECTKGDRFEWRGVQEGKDTNVRSTNVEPKKESVCPINGAPCSECKPGSPCAVEVAEDEKD